MIDERTRRLGQPDVGSRKVVDGESIGAWVVVRALAEGGFGSVYEVRHHRTDDRAALKLLHAHLVTSAEMLARFDREIQVIGMLRHPNIVRLVDAGFSRDGRPYLCMELLPGEDLGALLERRGSLSAKLALDVFGPVCEAVSAAHELNIIHRDIKASNIVICNAADGSLGRVVLLDFGIAKLTDALAPELTTTAQSLGTPSCMAPEQIHGLGADARTDVYALGGLLFHMLTGKMAFVDDSATMSQYLHLHARRPRASTLAAVSSRVDDIIVRAMAIEPSERFHDARALLAAARAALRDTAVVSVVGDVDTTAILVTVVDHSGGSSLDESLLSDLEAVLPAAERVLAGLGFNLAVDLGSSALFVARREGGPDPVEAALTTWRQLEHRPAADPRVKIGICVHRGQASFVGAEIQPCTLIRPATWRVPDIFEGVWVTAAIADAPGGKRIL